MTWTQTAPVVIAAAVFILAPGIAVGLALGARRFTLAGLAAPISMSLSAVLAVVAPFVGLPFTPAVYLGFSALAVIVIIALRWFLPKFRPLTAGFAANGSVPQGPIGKRLGSVLIVIALALSAIVITLRFTTGISSPENFSQTFDNNYHLNAVWHVAETQNGSSLTLGNLTDASRGFYPAAFADMLGLVVQLTGAAVPVVVNAATLVFGAVVWPLSCAFLISRVVGHRQIPLLAVGLFSAAFSASPYLLVAFGVLYPNFASLTLVPVAIGLAAEWLNLGPDKAPSRWASLIALILVVPGVTLTHPTALVTLFAFGVPMVFAWWFGQVHLHRSGRITGRRYIASCAALVVYLLCTVAIWMMIRPNLDSAPWKAFETEAGALGEVLASSPMGSKASWVLLAFTAIGFYVIGRHFRQQWWLLAMYVMGGLLYVFAAGWQIGRLRTLMTGVWYNDAFRLAALLPMVTLPLVVIGVEWLVFYWLRLIESQHRAMRADARPHLLTRVLSRLPLRAGTACMIVLLVLLAAGAQRGPLEKTETRLAEVFALKDDSQLVTSDEYALLQQVADHVPEGDTVVVNPFTGAALVYALAHRTALPPHMFGDRSEDEQLIIDHWDQAAYDPRVCDAVSRTRAYWALDFGSQTVIDTPIRYLGLEDVTNGTAPGISTVAQVGSARLVHLDVCTGAAQ